VEGQGGVVLGEHGEPFAGDPGRDLKKEKVFFFRLGVDNKKEKGLEKNLKDLQKKKRLLSKTFPSRPRSNEIH
jgi:hypothetical protein